MVKKTIGLLLGTVLLAGTGYKVNAISVKDEHEPITSPAEAQKEKNLGDLLANWDGSHDTETGSERGIGYTSGAGTSADKYQLANNFQKENVNKIGVDSESNLDNKSVSSTAVTNALNTSGEATRASFRGFNALEEFKLSTSAKVRRITDLENLNKIEVSNQTDLTAFGNTNNVSGKKLTNLTLKSNINLEIINIAANFEKDLEVNLENNGTAKENGLELNLARVKKIKSEGDKINHLIVRQLSSEGNFDFSKTTELKDINLTGGKKLTLALNQGSEIKLSTLNVDLGANELVFSKFKEKSDFEKVNVSKNLKNVKLEAKLGLKLDSNQGRVGNADDPYFILGSAESLKNISLEKTDVKLIGLERINASEIESIKLPNVKNNGKLYLALGNVSDSDLIKIKQKIEIVSGDKLVRLYKDDGKLTKDFENNSALKKFDDNLKQTSSYLFHDPVKGSILGPVLIVSGVVVLLLIGVGGYVFYKKRFQGKEEVKEETTT